MKGDDRSTPPSPLSIGRYDLLFPPEHQAILADRLPNAHLEFIERDGHNPQMERTAEVIEAVKRFMPTVIQMAPKTGFIRQMRFAAFYRVLHNP